MGFFRKKSDIIDYTDRGKNIPEIKSNYRMTSDGFIEFKGDKIDKQDNLGSERINTQPTNIPDSEVSATGTAFDFLDNPSSEASSTISLINNSDANFNSDVLEIKKMLRDVSSMSEANSNELYRLLHRLELLEKKMERLEGRGES